MSFQKKVEKMLDKYDIEEFMGDDSIDMEPFVGLSLETLGNENDDNIGLFGDMIDAALDASEVDDEDRDLLWNRAAFLLFSGVMKDEDGDFEELYAGPEGQIVILAGISFIDALEEEDDPDWALILNMHLYLRAFCEVVFAATNDAEIGAELLWQAEEAARIYCEAEEYEETYNVAHAALELFEDKMEEEAEGMKEAVGILWYYLGEGEEDDDTAEEYYRNAIDILDDPEILDDPVDEGTPELLEELKSDWEDDDEDDEDEDEDEE